MLVQIVGGAAVVGTKDIMAVSRACVHSFSGLRKLHPFRAISTVSTWPHPAVERLVHHCPASSRQQRFGAHAAALEEFPEQHQQHTRSRLSRAERYALVENFILKHKDAHEGKWPSVNAIVKEIGGSRVIVKDIVEELEKIANLQRDAKSLGSESSSSKSTLIASDTRNIDELGGGNSHEERPPEDVAHKSEDGHSRDNSSESGNSGPVATKVVQTSGSSSEQSEDVEAEPGLWRRLRDFGQETESGQVQGQALSLSPYDSDETESDTELDDEVLEFSRAEVSETQPQEGTGGRYKANSGHVAEANRSQNYGLFIRFLPRSASEADLRATFQDCGEIVRAQAMIPKGSGVKFTYGFVDFTTPEALSQALRKEKVFIKGSAVLTEPASNPRKADSRSARKSSLDYTKKGDTPVTFDSRPMNGNRGPGVYIGPNRVVSQPNSDSASRRSSSTNDAFYLVVVEGLPYPMPISGVEKMLSAHGDIARSELAREEGGTYSAHVEFKTEEARDSALASNRIYLGGRWCRVSTGEPILTTVVRLSNIGAASSNVILQRCAKLGRVESIVQRNQGVVDVYYHPSERRNMRKILDRLSDVHADYKRWHANLAPKCSVEELRNSPEVQNWVGLQKDKLLENLTSCMKLMVTDLEDLRELVDIERGDPHTSGKARTDEGMAAPQPRRT